MRSVFTGIDIGSHQVKVVIASAPENAEGPMQILGTGSAPSRGVRHGYVVDPKEAAKSIREAVARAAHASGTRVKSAYVSIGGVSLEECAATGDITLTASGGYVEQRDVLRALDDSRKKVAQKLVNRTIIHTIPLAYRIDGTLIHGRPLGLQGTRLSVDALLITVLSQHHDDLIEAIEGAGIEVEEMLAAPFAAAAVSLTKAQRLAGAVLANIGSETVSIIVYDDDQPVSLKVLPHGSADITNAIALSFQLPLSEAEQLKHGAVTGSDIPARKLSAVVSARLKDTFSQINAYLKSIGRQRLLPAGITLTGGGSGVPEAATIARETLKLPAQVGFLGSQPRLGSLDATWAVAYGLCRAAYIDEGAAASRTIGEVLQGAGRSISGFFRSLLP